MIGSSLLHKLLAQYFRFLAAGMVALLFLAAYFLVLSGKIDTIRQSGFQEKQRVSALVDQQTEAAKNLRESNKKFAEVFPAATLATVDTFLPSASDFPTLLLTIQDIAKTAGLDLTTIAIAAAGEVTENTPAPTTETTVVTAAPAAPSGVATEDVTITVNGGAGYTTFKRFIEMLETSRRLLDIQSLSYNRGHNKDGDIYTILLRTYYLPSTQ